LISGIRRPEARERDRGKASEWNSQNTCHIYGLSSPSYIGRSVGPKTIAKLTSQITDVL